MWHFLGNVVFPATITAVAGILAWIGTNFFADPILRFYRLRTVIHESLFFTGNVGSLATTERLDSATEELRRHAASLSAVWETSPRVVQRFFSWLRFDLQRAARGLTGLSNSLHKSDGSKALHRNDVEIGLCFAKTYTDSAISEIAKRISSGGGIV